jgi:hypothetical protein
MVNALCRFLIAKPDYEAVIIGSVGDIVDKMASKWASHKNLYNNRIYPNDTAAE